MTKNTEITAFAKKQTSLLLQDDSSCIDEWHTLLDGIRTSTQENLEKIEAEIKDVDASFRTLFIVSFTECRSKLLEVLKYNRDKRRNQLFIDLSWTSDIRGHAKTISYQHIGNGEISINENGRHLNSLDLDSGAVLMSLVPDSALEELADNLARQYECSQDGKTVEQLTEERKVLAMRLKELTEKKLEIRKVIGQLGTIGRAAEPIKTFVQVNRANNIPPGYPPGSQLINDGKILVLPPDPTSSHITIASDDPAATV